MKSQYWKLYTQRQRIWRREYTGIHSKDINNQLQISVWISYIVLFRKPSTIFFPHNVLIFVSPQIPVSAYLKTTLRFQISSLYWATSFKNTTSLQNSAATSTKTTYQRKMLNQITVDTKWPENTSNHFLQFPIFKPIHRFSYIYYI